MKDSFTKIKKLTSFLFQKELVGIIIALLITLSLNEIVFFYLGKGTAQRNFSGVSSILKNESSVGNSYFVSRSLSDLERLNFVTCVTLLESQPTKRSFYDTTYKEGCKNSDFLDGIEVEGEIQGAGGAVWMLKFKTPQSSFFILSRWFGRLISVVMVLGIFFVGKLLLRREKRSREKEVYKAQRIKDLAFQVAHDVASPLSALNLVSSHPSLDPNVRELLKISAQRTNEIIGSLRGQIKNFEERNTEVLNSVNLRELLSRALLEKKAFANIIEFTDISTDVFVSGNAVEISRVISNIINNAVEACEKTEVPKIRVSILLEGNLVNLTIEDNGKGMDSTVLKSIGVKGFTFQKQGGSGYGAFHAREYLKSIGGQITFESKVAHGTKAKLYFPKFNSEKE